MGRRCEWGHAPPLRQQLALWALLLAAACLSPGASGAAVTTYVTWDGQDTNSCLSQAAGCQSIGAALAAALPATEIVVKFVPDASGAQLLRNEPVLVDAALMNGTGATAFSVTFDGSLPAGAPAPKAAVTGASFNLTATAGAPVAYYLVNLTLAGSGANPRRAITAASGFGELHLTDCELRGFTAEAGGSGGAVYSAGPLYVTRCTFEDCEACTGGALAVVDATGTAVVQLADSTVRRSRASAGAGCPAGAGNGGGAFVQGALLAVANCEFSENQAAANGGGLALTFVADLQMTGTLLAYNNASTHGGGASCEGLVKGGAARCAFVGNRAGGDGGGAAFFPWGGNETLYLADSTLDLNYAQGSGGALRLYTVDQRVALRGLTLYANQAGAGYGGWSLHYGANMAVSGIAKPLSLVNSVLWSPGAAGLSPTRYEIKYDTTADEAKIVVSSCLIRGDLYYTTSAPAWHAGVLKADPLLGPLAGGRWRVPAHDSPVIDAGDTALAVSSLDQRGLTRVFYADVDLGAVEYDSLVYASPITFTGALEDQTFALAAPGVLQNITAPPGFTVAVLNSSQPADGCGAATVAPDGGLSLVPVHNFFGGCNFSFAMLDNGGQYMERTVVVSFGPVGGDVLFPDPIVISGAAEDTPFNLPAPGVLANFSAPPGVVVAVVNFSQPASACASVAVAANGSLSLVPAANFFGNCSFTFRVFDDVGALVEATVVVTIDARGDVTLPNPIIITGASEDQNFTLAAPGVLANASSPAGFNATVLNYTQPADGCAQVTVSATGELSLVPQPGFFGNCSFELGVLDDVGALLQSTVIVRIGSVVHGVTFPNPIVITGALEDENFTLPAPGVLANATAPATFTVAVLNYTQPADSCASVAVAPDGRLDLVPSPNVWGNCSFTFSVLDEKGNLVTATVRVVIGAVGGDVKLPNPIIVAGALENQVFTLPAPGVLANATAPLGVTVTVFNYSQPAGGCAQVTLALNGSLQLVPQADYSGNCSFQLGVLDDVGALVQTSVIVIIAPYTAVTTVYVSWDGQDSRDCLSEATGCASVQYALAQAAAADEAVVKFVPQAPATPLSLPNASIVINAAAAGARYKRVTFDGSLAAGSQAILAGVSFDLRATVGRPISFQFVNLTLVGNGGASAARAITAATGFGELHLTDCELRSYAAPGGSGGAVRSTGPLYATRCTFEDCEACTGGALAVDGVGSPVVWLEGVTVQGNRARAAPSCPPSSGNGGGASISKARLTVVDSTLEGNTASGSGGGLSVSELSSLHVTNSLFASNNATSTGGGISCTSIIPGVIERSALVGNRAGQYGGGLAASIYGGPDTLLITDSTVDSNYAAVVGGGLQLYVLDQRVELSGLTVYNNEAGADYGGWSLHFGTNAAVSGSAELVKLVNSVLWSPRAAGLSPTRYEIMYDFAANEANLDAASCLIRGDLYHTTSAPAWHAGVLKADPKLGPLVDGRWRLPAPDSPVIDAGDAALTNSTLDQRGLARVFNGEIDMGSVEYGGVIFPKPVQITGAKQDQGFTLAAPGVLADAVVAPGFTAAVLNYTQPAGGCGDVTVAPSGAMTFAPSPFFYGNCSFTFSVLDDAGALVKATAVVVVDAVSSNVTFPRPILITGAAEDTTFTLSAPGVLANASAPAGFILAVLNYTQPSDSCANVTLGTDGALMLVPARGFYGNCSFTFSVLDDDGAVVKAAVVVTFAYVVHGVTFPSPIVITGALEDENFTLPAPGVLANATAPATFTVAVLNYTQPADGCASVAVAPDGRLDLVPSPNVWGNCSFAFSVLDDQGNLVTATVRVVIGAVGGDVKLPNPIIVTGASENQAFTLPAPGVLANATAPLGVTVTVFNYSQPADSCAQVTLAPNGSLQLVPQADFSGNCSFQLGVLDDVGALVQTTVVVVITPFTLESTVYVTWDGQDSRDCLSEATGCASVQRALAQAAAADEAVVKFVPQAPATPLSLPNASIVINAATAGARYKRVTFDGSLAAGSRATLAGVSFDLRATVGRPVSFHFVNLTLVGNGAASAARAITAATGFGELHLTDCELRSYAASGGSGGAVRSTGPLYATRCTFQDCEACTGGAVSVDGVGNPVVRLEGVTVQGNRARAALGCPPSSGNGGGASIATAGLATVDSTFEGNTASGSGGGLSVSELSSLQVTNSLFASNNATSAASNGGGISCTSIIPGVIERSALIGNRAGQFGGGLAAFIYGGPDTLLITDSTVDSNYAAVVGGGLQLYVLDQRVELSGLTVYNNEAGADYGGWSLHFGTNAAVSGSVELVKLVNSVLWSPRAAGLSPTRYEIMYDFAANEANLDAASCLIRGDLYHTTSAPAWHAGVLKADPKLGPLVDGRWRLPAPDSPVIDAGDAALTNSTLDQRGLARVFNGEIDMGSVEYGGVIFPKPVQITGAKQDQGFTLAAPGVLADAVVAPGFTVAVLNYTQPAGGCGDVTVAPSGAMTFAPSPFFYGNCSFTFSVLDDAGALVKATAVVVVDAVSSNVTFPRPILITGAAEDTTFTLSAPGVLANASAPAGFTLAVLNYTQPSDSCANVTLGTDGALMLVPARGFYGNCSFTFSVLDDARSVVKAAVVVTFAYVVHGVTFPHPIVITGALEDDNFTLPAPGVLANATAPATFTVAVLNYTQPADGCASVAIAPDGRLDLVPSPNVWGNCSFTFAVLDEKGNLVTATVVVVIGAVGGDVKLPNPIIVTGASENQVFTLPAPGVLVNATAPLGVTVTVFNYSQPADGCAQVTLAVNGSLQLVPQADYSGNCSFRLGVLDDVGALVQTTAVVVIAPSNTVSTVYVTWNGQDSRDCLSEATGCASVQRALAQAAAADEAVVKFVPQAPATPMSLPNASIVINAAAAGARYKRVTFDGTLAAGARATLPGMSFDLRATAGRPVSFHFVNLALVGSGAASAARAITAATGFGELHLTDCELRSYAASGGSGGAVRSTGPLYATRCTFEDCEACTGGAVSVDGAGSPVVRLEGVTVRGNRARAALGCPPSSGNGGGASIATAGLAIVDSTFEGNTASGSGGGLSVSELAGLQVTASLFTSNNATSAASNGGGISCTSIIPGVIKRSALVGNRAGQYGGGLAAFIYGGPDTLLITDSTVDSNYAAVVGGGLQLYVLDQRVELSGLTVYNNEAGADYGGWSLHFGTNAAVSGSVELVKLVNSVLWSPRATGLSPTRYEIMYNFAANEANLDAASCLIRGDLYYTTSAPAWHAGMLKANPKLGPLVDGRWRLPAPDSPAVDAGDAALTNSTLDQRGLARVFNGEIDMGAVEYRSTKFPSPILFSGALQDQDFRAPALGVLADASVTPGFTLAVLNASQPASKCATVAVAPDGSFLMQPALGFVGNCSFTFSALDAEGGLDTPTVVVQFASYTSAVTIPSPIVLEGVEDTLLTLGAPGVLANATAPAGFNVSVYSYSQPASGCANVTLGTDGALTMMPAKGFFGNCSFLLWVLDNQSKVVKATVAAVFAEVIHNVIAPANSIYVPGAFESTTFQLAPPGVLKQFKKPPSFNLTVYNYTQPASGCGTVQLAPDGGMDFEPNPAFVGTCSFNFSVLDEKQMPLQATVLVNVGPVSPTVTVPDPILIMGAVEDTTFTLDPPGVLANISAPVGTVTEVLSYTQPADGCANVTLSPVGGLVLVPRLNVFGACNFTFTLLDENNGSIMANVTVQIADVPDQVIIPDPIVITGAFEDANFSLAAPGVLKDVVAPPSVNMRVLSNSQPTDPCARVTVAPNGSLTLQPKAGFFGNCSFTFRVPDVSGPPLQANATVVIAKVTKVATVYVGWNGSDTNNCLSAGTSCATIQRAVKLAAANDDITVKFVPQPPGSTLVLNASSVLINAADAGAAYVSITFDGALPNAAGPTTLPGMSFDLRATVGRPVSFHFVNLTLVGNGAASAARAITAATGFGELHLTDCELRGYSAGNSSGGAVFSTVTTNITRCKFESCDACSGGALAIGDDASRPLARLDRVTIASCRATGAGCPPGGARGGGLRADGARLVLLGCALTSNLARDDGGGAALTLLDSLEVADTLFSSNTAGLDGGGLWAQGQIPGKVTRSAFVGNSAGQNGGGALVAAWGGPGNLTVTDSTFDSNTAANAGGGLRLSAADQLQIDLRGLTLFNNSANAAFGSSLHFGSSAAPPVRLHNSILWSAPAAAGAPRYEINYDNASAHAQLLDVRRCIVRAPVFPTDVAPPPAWVNGTINLNPRLGALVDGRWRAPAAAAPAVDAGDNALVASALDQRGAARIYNNIVDIGAVEFAAVIFPNPILLTGAVEGRTFTQPAPGVLGYATVPAGTELTVIGNTQPDTDCASQVIVAADGSLALQADASFTGNCSFSFTAQDQNGATTDANVTVQIDPATDTVTFPDPVVITGAYSGRTLNIPAPGVLQGAIAPAGFTVQVSSNTPSSPGCTINALNPDGSMAVQMDAGFVGNCSFTFTVMDPRNLPVVANAVVVVGSLNVMTAYVTWSGSDTNDCVIAAAGCASITAALTKVAGAANVTIVLVANPNSPGSPLSLSEAVLVPPGGALASLAFVGSTAGGVTSVTGATFNLAANGVDYSFSGLGLSAPAGGVTLRGIAAVGSGGSLALRGCALSGFSAVDMALPNLDGLGGGVYSAVNLVIERTTIDGCQARDGGAVYFAGAAGAAGATLTGAALRRNTASPNAAGNAGTGRGGGVFFQGAGVMALALANCTLESNQASADGGGVAAAGLGGLDVANSTMRSNSAGTDGGALSVAEAAAGDVRSSAFLGNTAVGRGGALALVATASGADLLLHTSTFDGNSASGAGGGAIFLSLGASRAASLYSLTVSGSSTAGLGSSLLLAGAPPAAVKLANSILWSASQGAGRAEVAAPDDTALTVTSCIVAGGLSGGTGVLSSDPQLGPLQPGGWRLPAAGGPSVNAGSMAAPRDTLDQRGLGRVVDGTIDIGAVEYRLVRLKSPLNFTAATEGVTYNAPAPGVLQVAFAPAGVTPSAGNASVPACASSVSVAMDGSFQLVPVTNFNGQCAFNFTYTDGEGAQNPAQATVVFAPVVSGVTLVDPLIITGGIEGTRFFQNPPGVLAGAVGPPGFAVRVSAYFRPPDGCAKNLTVWTQGAFDMVPAANFNGNCSFVIQVLDENNATINGTVVVQFAPVQHGVVFQDPIVLTGAVEDTTYVLPAPGVVAAPYVIAAAPTWVPAVSTYTQPADGCAVVTVGTDGSVTAVPAANYNGNCSFSFFVLDETQKLARANVIIVFAAVQDFITLPNPIIVAGVEDTPLNLPAPGVLAGAVASPGSTLNVTGFTQPAPGCAAGPVAVQPSGALAFAPASFFFGNCSFAIMVASTAGVVVNGTVVVVVAHVNHPPTGQNQTFETLQGVRAPITGLANNATSGAPNEPLPYLVPQLVAGALHGTVCAGSCTASFWTYDPAPEFAGTDYFTFRLVENGTTVASAVLYAFIRVNPIVENKSGYRSPQASSLLVSATSGLLSRGGVAYSAYLTAVLVPGSGPAQGTLSLNADGSFTYTPSAGAAGVDSFRFTAVTKDGTIASGERNATITIDSPPVLSPSAPTSGGVVTLTSGKDVVMDVNVLRLFVDPNGDTVASAAIVDKVDPATAGTATLSGGLLTFTPAPGFSGDVKFSVRACSLTCSAAVPVRITVGGGKRLLPPTIQKIAVRLEGCTSRDIAVDDVSLTAAALRTVKRAAGGRKGAAPQLVLYGAPKGVQIEVAKASNGSRAWPADGASCLFVQDTKGAQAGAPRSVANPSTKRIYACLQRLGFRCGDALVARARAFYKDSPRAPFLPSDWSSAATGLGNRVMLTCSADAANNCKW